MADLCLVPRGLCRMRATLLDDLGDIANVSNNSWVSQHLLSVGISPDIETGDTGTLKNGCGATEASFADNDAVKRYNITIVDTRDEPGLRAMMLGLDLIMDAADVIGTSAVDQTSDDFEPARVALELWLKLYDSDAQDQTRPWKYINFPGTYSWVPQDIEIGADFSSPGFAGKSFKNELWGDGPYGDIDWDPAGQLGPVFNEAQVAEDPPASACGFAHIAPGS
jgi:hypothetical protein